MAALTEAAARGDIRRDLAPELLAVPVLGAINVLVRGRPGDGLTTAPTVRTVLDTLERLLAPPASPIINAHPEESDR